MLRSRRDFKRGDLRGAIARAQRAVELAARSSIALVNLASLAFNVGDFDMALTYARDRWLEPPRCWNGRTRRGLRRAYRFVGRRERARLGRLLQALVRRQISSGHTHFAGVGYLNLANCLRALGDAVGSLEAATLAVDLLSRSRRALSWRRPHAVRAWAQAYLDGVEASATRKCCPRKATSTSELQVGDAHRARRHRSLVRGLGEGCGRPRGASIASGRDAMGCGHRLMPRAAHFATPSWAARRGRRALAGIPIERALQLDRAQGARSGDPRPPPIAERNPSAAEASFGRPRASEESGGGFWLTYSLGLLEPSPVMGWRCGDSFGTRDYTRLAAMSMAAELVAPRLGDLEALEVTRIESRSAT